MKGKLCRVLQIKIWKTIMKILVREQLSHLLTFEEGMPTTGGNRCQSSLYKKVIISDHRISGRSKCCYENFDRNLFDTDVLAILGNENIEMAAIVCQSMVSWTGLITPLFHSELVRCLILSNTPGGIWTPSVGKGSTKIKLRFADCRLD